MLAAARSAAEGEGMSVEWREGSAVKLPLADDRFDVALCQQGLQFFPDRPAALSEMHRILASGRRLVLSYTAGSALVGLVAAASDHARSALLAEVNAGLQSFIDDRGLAFPIESNVAVARK